MTPEPSTNQYPNHSPKKGLTLALIGVVIIAALITWGLKSSKQPVSTTPDTGTTAVAQWPSKSLKKETITDNTKTYQISAEYPVTGRDDITAKLRGFVEDQIATFKTDTTGMPEDFRAVTLDISYDEDQNNLADNYIFHIYSDTGGAHGIEATHTVSFDASGDEIMLSDLFSNETKGLQLVSEYVKEELMKREFADSVWISEGAAPVDENYQNFTVDEDGITVMFDPYQVAAYAAGPQMVIVPVSAFKSQANLELFK